MTLCKLKPSHPRAQRRTWWNFHCLIFSQSLALWSIINSQFVIFCWYFNKYLKHYFQCNDLFSRPDKVAIFVQPILPVTLVKLLTVALLAECADKTLHSQFPGTPLCFQTTPDVLQVVSGTPPQPHGTSANRVVQTENTCLLGNGNLGEETVSTIS